MEESAAQLQENGHSSEEEEEEEKANRHREQATEEREEESAARYHRVQRKTSCSQHIHQLPAAEFCLADSLFSSPPLSPPFLCLPPCICQKAEGGSTVGCEETTALAFHEQEIQYTTLQRSHTHPTTPAVCLCETQIPVVRRCSSFLNGDQTGGATCVPTLEVPVKTKSINPNH